MRRLLTTLMILLVVIVAGLSALVLMVNPNDFRDYLVNQVSSRSGYQLELNGRLRWHVWPQLSILTGRMSLTEPGASAPLVRADNMRLDVALIPLLSHQLKVKQVMLKGAVIELTPQTEAVKDAGAPVAPRETTQPLEPAGRGWSFDIASLRVHDSVLVFQHEDDEQVTVRDINLDMQQDEHHQAEVDFSGRINRDQRDLNMSFSAQVDAGDYPRNLTATLNSVNWQLKGAGLPTQGVTGQGSLQARWQEDAKKLSFSQLQLTANDSSLRGDASVVLSEKPQWALNLQSDKLNLDNLLLPPVALPPGGGGQHGQAAPARQQRPVIADSAVQPDYISLRGYSADVNLQAGQLQWRGLPFTNVRARAQNSRGLLTISQLSGELNKGSLSLPGSLDAREDVPRARFKPDLRNVEVEPLLKAFAYPIDLTGQLSLSGDFNGSQIDADSFRRGWDGHASVELQHFRARGLNFQQLIQQAVERTANVKAKESVGDATELDNFTSALSLDSGMLSLDDMAGHSKMLALTGEGTLDLVRQDSDVRFNVRVLQGWEGQGKVVSILKETPIPLRVYGQWDALNYSLQVDQVLRKALQDDVRSKLQKWADKNQNKQSGKDVKKFLDNL